MLKFKFDIHSNEKLRVMCLGAHSDDIEIGCGGTLLKLIDNFPNIEVTWVVFSATGTRGVEAQNSADSFIKNVRSKTVSLNEFEDGYFPYLGMEIKSYFEKLKQNHEPDLIFTHYRDDLHQDHRKICELTWNTWRNHFILEYEIPKYDGDLGNPNFYVGMNEQICEMKIEKIMSYFQTQENKYWFSPETFLALLRLRGIECKSSGGYAEAFYSRKVTLG